MPPRHKIRAPLLPLIDDLETASPEIELQSRQRYELTHFKGQDFSDIQSFHTTFDECRLQQLNLARSELVSLELNDVVLSATDMANACWSGAIIYRSEFEASRAVGANFNEAFFKDVTFREMNLMLAQFRFARFQKARFEQCNLTSADFQNADLRGVVFEECILNETQFSFANLQNADIRGCKIENLAANAQCLKGLIVEPFQATYFANLLGLQVRWDNEE